MASLIERDYFTDYEILKDPYAYFEAIRAVLEQHFAGISTDKRISMAKGMTMRAMKKFAPDQFTDEALDAVDADLAKLA